MPAPFPTVQMFNQQHEQFSQVHISHVQFGLPQVGLLCSICLFITIFLIKLRFNIETYLLFT